MIFMQDRIILENQRPILLPMEPRSEIPTRADATSVAYRRWLKEKGVRYGTTIAA
jgi:phenylpropionate dioxygenase-like ring-hydroxylating dioxygenase large terminal subunit